MVKGGVAWQDDFQALIDENPADGPLDKDSITPAVALVCLRPALAPAQHPGPVLRYRIPLMAGAALGRARAVLGDRGAAVAIGDQRVTQLRVGATHSAAQSVLSQ